MCLLSTKTYCPLFFHPSNSIKCISKKYKLWCHRRSCGPRNYSRVWSEWAPIWRLRGVPRLVDKRNGERIFGAVKMLYRTVFQLYSRWAERIYCRQWVCFYLFIFILFLSEFYFMKRTDNRRKLGRQWWYQLSMGCLESESDCGWRSFIAWIWWIFARAGKV